MKAIILLYSVVLLLSTPVHAEPSYEETVNFLKEKLNTQSQTQDSGRSGLTLISRQRLLESSKCHFTIVMANNGIKKINRRLGETYGALKRQISFDASKLNPKKISVDGDTVVIRTMKNKKVISSKAFFEEPGRIGYCNNQNARSLSNNGRSCYLEVMINAGEIRNTLSPTSDNIPRVTKALRHLVKLCGGKGELF